jgi:predicted ABC-type ATPase
MDLTFHGASSLRDPMVPAFARKYLPNDARVLNFINADLIAAGLSPLAPQHAAIAAARVMLPEIDRLSAERLDFAFESTLSGQTYARRLTRLRYAGYDIEYGRTVRSSRQEALVGVDPTVVSPAAI